ncbi:MAG: DUF2283 domain-containing protein [Desulfobacteraceae bacterium]|nr:DUF2283 domain-containing protein [Desulfobacteraceae bacterium]
MDELKLHQSELTTGESVKMVYNETDDILEIFFGENEPATGIELTDHILLRFSQKESRAVSLTIRHFSILTEQTEYGPRSYPLDSIDELPEELRESVIHSVMTAPVNQFLKMTCFQTSPVKSVPFTYVEPYQFAAVT